MNVLFAVLLALTSFVLAAAFRQISPGSGKAKSAPTETQSLHAEVDALSAQALALPPEFAADILIRLASRPDLFDPPTRIEDLKSAFELAGRAQLASPVNLSEGAPVDSVIGRRGQASELGLDTLSLRCRAVKALLALNKRAAVTLFQQIQVPASDSAECGNGLYADLHAYYELLGEMSNAAQPKARVDYFVDALSQIRSISQVEPFIRALLNDAVISDQDRSALAIDLAQRMHLFHPDPGGFTGAIESNGFIPKIRTLFDRLRKSEEEGAVTVLLNETRSVIVRNLSNQVCIAPAASGRTFEWNVSKTIKMFNDDLMPLADKNRPAGTIRPIEQADVVGGTQTPVQDGFAFWKSPQSQAMLRMGQTLNRTDITQEERLAAVDRLLELLASWEAESEPSPEVYFLEKSIILGELSALGQQTQREKQFFGEFVEFLAGNPYQTDSRAVWFQTARELLFRLRRDADMNRKKLLLEDLKRSRDPILSTYAALEIKLPGIWTLD